MLWSCWSSDSFFFFKQKTAYELRISDRSSDVCSSDLPALRFPFRLRIAGLHGGLAAMRGVVREIELRFGQAERARHRDELGMLVGIADLGLMAQRLPRVDIFADLGERHRYADVWQLLERAPRSAVGPDILALACRLAAELLGGEQAAEGFLLADWMHFVEVKRVS